MNVLIIEDDTQLNIAITRFFEIKNYNTTSLKDGLVAIDYIDSDGFDLYIIDINLPGINGLDLLNHIRKKDLNTPVIIITASLEIENLTNAYEKGCSEYLKKPFHLKELEVRLNRLLNTDESEIIHFDDGLFYNKNQALFYYANKPIELRHKEKRFCELLISHINKVVSVETIEHYVWENEEKTIYPLRQLVAELRRKLPIELIKTKVKEGYIIENHN